MSDEDAVQDLLYRLSDESAFFRFFGHAVTHPHREVLNLVELDPSTSVAFVARLLDTDVLVGIARADCTPRGRSAELGVTIADAWQRRGIGTALLERLIEACRAGGFERLVAEVLPENRGMQRLLRRFHFSCNGEPFATTLYFQLEL